jgi:anaerobic C4-dicarboxylate transporter
MAVRVPVLVIALAAAAAAAALQTQGVLMILVHAAKQSWRKAMKRRSLK